MVTEVFKLVKLFKINVLLFRVAFVYTPVVTLFTFCNAGCFINPLL